MNRKTSKIKQGLNAGRSEPLGNIPRTRHAFKAGSLFALTGRLPKFQHCQEVLVTDGLAAGLLGQSCSSKTESPRFVVPQVHTVQPKTRSKRPQLPVGDQGSVYGSTVCWTSIQLAVRCRRLVPDSSLATETTTFQTRGTEQRAHSTGVAKMGREM